MRGACDHIRLLIDGWGLHRSGLRDAPALVLVQGDDRVRIELIHARYLVAGMADAAADLAEVLAAEVYHA